MSTYPAERYLPGITPEQLLDAARRAKATAGPRPATCGPRPCPGPGLLLPVRRPRRPGGRAGQRQAGIPYERIVAAVHVASDDLA